MTYFCPACWIIIPAETRTCPHCDCDLAAAGERSYPERLIAALNHPVAETRVLAAEILGQLHYAHAITPLLERARKELLARCPDVELLAALLRSARKIGAPKADWQKILILANSKLLNKLVQNEN